MENYAELLTEMKAQKQELMCQKEQIQSNYNQILGAIYALDTVIKKIEANESKCGDSNDEANNKETQQSA